MSTNNRETTAFGIPKCPLASELRFSFYTKWTLLHFHAGRRALSDNLHQHVLLSVSQAEETWLFLFLTRIKECDELPKASGDEEVETDKRARRGLDVSDYSTSFATVTGNSHSNLDSR